MNMYRYFASELLVQHYQLVKQKLLRGKRSVYELVG